MNAQILYDILTDFLEANPEMPMIEVFGVFEIVKLQYKEQIEREIRESEGDIN